MNITQILLVVQTWYLEFIAQLVSQEHALSKVYSYDVENLVEKVQIRTFLASKTWTSMPLYMAGWYFIKLAIIEEETYLVFQNLQKVHKHTYLLSNTYLFNTQFLSSMSINYHG